MRFTTASVTLALAAFAAARSSNGTSAPLNAVPSSWDGSCYYPKPDIGFQLESYLGKWFQVAGTVAPFTAGCKCIQAQYELNDNGTVAVNNTCQAQGQAINILGTAAPADPTYGAAGVFQVGFPGQAGPSCPGPNYIVQDYTGDFAIVQSNNFTTLFVLSREREVEDDVLDVWIHRAGLLGSNLDDVIKNDQTGCLF
ncbi:hypothetical protein Q7P36_010628 [Cladosporium allicinum]